MRGRDDLRPASECAGHVAVSREALFLPIGWWHCVQAYDVGADDGLHVVRLAKFLGKSD